ncbi:MAG: RidA family protein [Dehalococcoidia bacterium]|nr:RidA family protein [Dehalococcoidia bacterium]
MPKRAVYPNPAAKPRGYSPAVRAGNLVYVSGQLALDAKDQIVGAGDAHAQARQCFKNMEAVLTAAGTSLASVVKITAFLIKIEDFPAYAGVRAEVFPQDGPASSTVVVSALAVAGCLVEVEAVALLD